MLQDKAMTRMRGIKGVKGRKKVSAEKMEEDIGPILRT
jgi:hypothetical protein